MAKFALEEHGFVKEVTSEIPTHVHLDLQKMYKRIPAFQEAVVKPGWRFIGGDFVEPLSYDLLDTWDKKLKWIKAERNRLLAATDKYLILDYPIGPDELQAVKEYRIQLRDFPQKVRTDIRSVKEVVFPKNPID